MGGGKRKRCARDVPAIVHEEDYANNILTFRDKKYFVSEGNGGRITLGIVGRQVEDPFQPVNPLVGCFEWTPAVLLLLSWLPTIWLAHVHPWSNPHHKLL